MKKVMLILICLTIFLLAVSCDKSKTSVEMSYNNNSTDEIQSIQKTSENICFLNYDNIVQRYCELLGCCNKADVQYPKSYLTENDYLIENALQEVVVNSNGSRMGYAIYDVNNDSQDELFLMDEQYYVYAVFTQLNDMPVLLSSFGRNNHYVALDQNGVFYQTGYGKEENSYTKIMQIGVNGKFEILLEYGYDDSVGEYYIIENNVRHIAESRDIADLNKTYEAFLQEPSETTKASGILFILAIE